MIRILLIFISFTSFGQSADSLIKQKQDSIILDYYTNCALGYNYNYNMFEWQDCLSKGLKKDSTIATLWQKKAMPYFKARKYEVGMEFIDKAVKYDTLSHLPYRGFIKCIFSKQYKEAILDLEICEEKWPGAYVMDHSYLFYIGLSYLQLNNFEKANEYLTKTVEQQNKKFGNAHPLNLLYLGITKMELRDIDNALFYFDEALKYYPEFPLAWYYKGLVSYKAGNDEGLNYIDKASEFSKMGYTINEDNAIYEKYPYEIDLK